jgi:hypothetical protein
MGKTFLMKRIGYHRESDGIDIPYVAAAGKVGRIIGIECSAFVQELIEIKIDTLLFFWNYAVIVYLCRLFNDCTVDGILFSSLSPKGIKFGGEEKSALNVKPVTVDLNVFSIKDVQQIINEHIQDLNQQAEREFKTPNFNRDPTLLPLIISSYLIPRMVKIAVTSWYENKRKNGTQQNAIVDFSDMVSSYYSDVSILAESYSPSEFALLSLACSSQFRLPPGIFRDIRDLVERSVIFRTSDSSYIMPLMWWMKANFSHWKAITAAFSELVPGVALSDLHIHPTEIAQRLTTSRGVGYLYETILSSSLAIKYQMLTRTESSNQPINLGQILPELCSTYPEVSELDVNLSMGVITPSKEAKLGNSECLAICINRDKNNAHHDAILSNSIALQYKNSRQRPYAPNIKRQLSPPNTLLWCYLGMMRFADKITKMALDKGELAIISGRSVISKPLFDLLISLKVGNKSAKTLVNKCTE